MSEWQHHRFSDFLIRSKVPITISDNRSYKRITIKTRHGGIFLRDIAAGDKIGTKKQFIVKEGQFVLSKIDARYGAFGITSSEVDAAIITGNFWAYDVNQNIISIEWLNNFTNSEHFYDICERASRGTTHRKYLDEEIFLNNELVIPDVATQIKILEQLNCKQILHQEIANCLTHQQTLLKKLRQQILQEAIEGKLSADWRQQNPNTEPASELLKRIQAEKAQLVKTKKIKAQKPLPPISPEEKPFDLPDGWEWCRLEDAGLFERGKSKHRPRNDEALFVGGKYPFIQTGDVAQSKKYGFRIRTYSKLYNDKGLSQSRLWEKETLCITIAANIAETGFLDITACFPDSVVGFKSFEDSSTSYYVKYFIDATRHEIEKFAPATAQKNINLGIINMLLFPLPPIAEQKAIVAKVEKLLALCDQLESKINQSQHHANSLMQAALQEAFAGASI